MANLTTAEVLQKLQSSDFKAVEGSIIVFLKSVSLHDIITIPMTPKMMMSGTSDSQARQMRLGYVNEWAAIFVSLFKSKNYKPTENFLEALLYYKHAFDWFFSASHWKNTDTLINELGMLKADYKGRLKLKESQLLKLLALICLNSSHRLPWADFIKALPGVTTTAYIALINQSFPAISKESSDGFNFLLESAKDFPMLEFENPAEIEKFLGSFFHCSYATSPKKYEFKKWLTKLIRFNCEKQWLTGNVKLKLKEVPTTIKFIKNSKPKMLVMIENLQSDNAMFRCFKATLEDLSKNYHLVGLAIEKYTDKNAQYLFEEMHFIKDNFNISNNAEQVLSIQPDVIFYPSIGMSLWTICLSQLRLAPKQVMMGGHPSCSYSNVIDDFILPIKLDDPKELQQFYNERIITLNAPEEAYTNLHDIHSELTPDFISKYQTFNENSNEIRIGINGIITKVTYDIVKVCQRIEQNTKKKVTFVFYVGTPKNSIAYLAIFNIFTKMLKHFELSHYQGYIPYMKSISGCHFLLPTLPFGGSNSNVDAMILSRPKLFIKGNKEIYTRCDNWEWDRINLGDILGCNSVDELVDKSLKFIESDDYRKEIHELISSRCSIKQLFQSDVENSNGLPKINALFSAALKSEDKTND